MLESAKAVVDAVRQSDKVLLVTALVLAIVAYDRLLEIADFGEPGITTAVVMPTQNR